MIDTEWFFDKIKNGRYGSLRQVARRMIGRHGKPMDISALSLMLRGKRDMRIDEARQLSDLLEIPLAEVLNHASPPSPGKVTRKRS